MPTTSEIVKYLKENGIHKVNVKDLVKGCHYLLVFSGSEQPTFSLYYVKYKNYESEKHKHICTHWMHFEGIDEEGDPIFEGSTQIPLEQENYVYGHATWYTYDPHSCDQGELDYHPNTGKKVKEAASRFASGAHGGATRRRRRRARRIHSRRSSF